MKLLGLSTLAVNFGGLVKILKPDVYPRAGKPFTFVGDLVLPTRPAWTLSVDPAPIMITSREQAEKLFGKGSAISRCCPISTPE